jgi:uncharacterized alkaline shock family protein YloU
MAEQTTPAVSRAGAPSAEAGSGSARREGDGEGLQSERGRTNIADAVVTRVAAIATREVPGVHELGGTAARALGAMGERVGIHDERSRGVAVEVGEREAAVDLTVVIDYGESIPTVSQKIRENVIKRIEGITGLRVTEVNVVVNDLYFPGDEQPESGRVE